MVNNLISAIDTISWKLEGVNCNLFMMKDINLMPAYGKLDA